MKILIVYSGKTGTTKECVGQLQNELRGLDVTVADADRDLPPLDGFDLFVVGSAIRYEKIRPSIRKFLKENETVLLEKPLGFFLCCGMQHNFELYRDRAFPKKLLEHAFEATTFGGTLSPKKAGLWDRIVLRIARKFLTESEIEDGEYTPTMPGLLPENISKLADRIRTFC